MDEEIPNLVTAQASSISITSFVSKGVSLLIAQYMPSLRVKSNVCTNIICTHISHANTTSPNAQIPFYWTLIAYFSPRHLTQVGRNENAYLELQNATRFNRLCNLTSNFSNTKVRIVHLKAISLGYYRSQNYAFCNALLLRKMILETIFGSQVNLDLKIS